MSSGLQLHDVMGNKYTIQLVIVEYGVILYSWGSILSPSLPPSLPPFLPPSLIVHCVCHFLYPQFTQVDAFSRDAYSRTGQGLLGAITTVHPFTLSTVLERTVQVVDSLGEVRKRRRRRRRKRRRRRCRSICTKSYEA